ncbi:MAG: putative serine protease HtrA [Syntrophorhabdus sp. PtaU1.Bin153]|nr:MAG: putative serine protease HtrA [Syntrophorhabdus sp. PtaU1.Bin153]
MHRLTPPGDFKVRKLLLTVAAIVVIGLSLFVWWQAPLSLPALIKETQPSVVTISVLKANGNITALGTGFFVSKDGDIITNRYVIDGASRIRIKTRDGRTYRVNRVISVDKHSDLACVRANIPTQYVRPLQIEASLPEVGERVVVLGNPKGLERTASDGIVSAVRHAPGFGRVVQITAPISPGSSGSPVINGRGRVIGVVAFLMEGQNLNFSISGERVERLVHGTKNGTNRRKPSASSKGMGR